MLLLRLILKQTLKLLTIFELVYFKIILNYKGNVSYYKDGKNETKYNIQISKELSKF